MKSSNINSETTDLNLNINPAYEAQTHLHKNLAYESTTHTGEVRAQSSTSEPTYEIISPATNQSASTAAVEMITSEEAGVECDEINRERDTTASQHLEVTEGETKTLYIVDCILSLRCGKNKFDILDS